MNDGSGLKYFLTDHLGSVVAITDDEGDLISQHRYLPFGGTRQLPNQPTSGLTDYGYTGQRNLDDDIGLMDYKARFYSPTLNRFIQPDTIVPDPTTPQAYNRFSYVYNNPIAYNDPTGHFTCSSNRDSHDFCPGNSSLISSGSSSGSSGDGGGSSGGGGGRGDESPSDSNGNGIPDSPVKDWVYIHPSGICEYNNLVECLYAGKYWPEGDYTFTDKEWNSFLYALYLNISDMASEGDGFWTTQYDVTGRKGVDPFFIPFHTESYFLRQGYDTPFWNGDETGNNALSGNVCFNNGKCHNRNDVNYVAQGMWSAANETHIGALAAAYLWKSKKYEHGPTADVYYWAYQGASIYMNFNNHPYVNP